MLWPTSHSLSLSLGDVGLRWDEEMGEVYLDEFLLDTFWIGYHPNSALDFDLGVWMNAMNAFLSRVLCPRLSTEHAEALPVPVTYFLQYCLVHWFLFDTCLESSMIGFFIGSKRRERIRREGWIEESNWEEVEERTMKRNNNVKHEC